ncbi:MAG: S-adenosylmethionine:tRNA ribosyltransferase-isomerase [Acidimicrobiaceae bacterium]|jgi:S-adenosylmethionine:tRNA ribosyltransferase-isomerase
MDASALDYSLPEEAIAQTPAPRREDARLLVDRGQAVPPDHRRVADLPDLLRPGDLLVVNDSRVLPARLHVRKPSGGVIEVLLLERCGPGDDGMWRALLRPSRKVRPGLRMEGEGDVVVDVVADLGDGCWRLRLEGDLGRGGELPLPPYIHEPLRQPDRYQTVYARRAVSAAAPTAGLHLTEEVLERCRTNGIGVATVELAIGLDTFRPVTSKRLEDHPMHSEAYEVPEETMAACATAERVVVVGTTVVRALESAVATGELSGRTALFIRPGFEFRAVDVLLTNFHLPRTTLLAMIEAFVGPRWRDLYDIALREGYRFLSFGDAMLLERA